MQYQRHKRNGYIVFAAITRIKIKIAKNNNINKFKVFDHCAGALPLLSVPSIDAKECGNAPPVPWPVPGNASQVGRQLDDGVSRMVDRQVGLSKRQSASSQDNFQRSPRTHI